MRLWIALDLTNAFVRWILVNQIEVVVEGLWKTKHKATEFTIFSKWAIPESVLEVIHYPYKYAVTFSFWQLDSW